MAAVDPSYAIALKNDALYLRAVTGAVVWAQPANEKTLISPLALRADAAIEAVRQIGFLGVPLVRDRVVVRGARRDLVGKAKRMRGPSLGYQAIVPCFVIGAEEGAATTILTVLRRAA